MVENFAHIPSARTMRDYLKPAAQTFDPGMSYLLPNFHGLGSENPWRHVTELEELCFSNEVDLLKLFPYTPRDEAQGWLKSLNPRSTVTWPEMQK